MLTKQSKDYPSVTCALIVKNSVDTQCLRFLVVLQHSVGVKGGGIIHLLHIGTRLLALREMKSYLTVYVTDALWGPNCLTHRPLGKYLTISTFVFIWKDEAEKLTETQWSPGGKSALMTAMNTDQSQLQRLSGKALILMEMIFIPKLRRRDIALMGNRDQEYDRRTNRVCCWRDKNMLICVYFCSSVCMQHYYSLYVFTLCVSIAQYTSCYMCFPVYMSA